MHHATIASLYRFKVTPELLQSAPGLVGPSVSAQARHIRVRMISNLFWGVKYESV